MTGNQLIPPAPRAQFELTVEPTAVPLLTSETRQLNDLDQTVDIITLTEWDPAMSIEDHQEYAKKAIATFERGYARPSDHRLRIAHGLLFAAGIDRAVILAGETGSGKTFAMERLIGNGEYTLDVQPDTREAAVKGYISPMNMEYIPGALRGTRIGLDELGNANNTAGVNTVFKRHLVVGGHEIDSASIAIAATTNFPERGSNRTNLLDSATLGRFAAYILMGDSDIAKGRRFRAMGDKDLGIPLFAGTIPHAETRLAIGNALAEIDSKGQPVQDEQDRIVETIMRNSFLDMQSPDDARLFKGLWNTARAARFVGLTVLPQGAKLQSGLQPEEIKFVAPLVLPKSVSLSDRGRDKLQSVLDADIRPIDEQVALRQALTAIVFQGDPTLEKTLSTKAFARDDYRHDKFAQFAFAIAA